MSLSLSNFFLEPSSPFVSLMTLSAFSFHSSESHQYFHSSLSKSPSLNESKKINNFILEKIYPSFFHKKTKIKSIVN